MVIQERNGRICASVYPGRLQRLIRLARALRLLRPVPAGSYKR